MKIVIKLVCPLLLLFVISCNTQKEVEAKIFERKEQEGNKLLIKYRYSVSGKEYVDSATIDNINLEGDLITVNYQSSNPANAVPRVKK